MLKEKKVAAFFTPWKLKIARLKRGDHVFLYRSGTVLSPWARPMANYEKPPTQDKAEHKDEEYAMRLLDFTLVEPPLSCRGALSRLGTAGYAITRTKVGNADDGFESHYKIAS